MYKVTEYKGDFQIENQRLWGQKFFSVEVAGAAARAAYRNRMPFENDKSYYAMVETDKDLGDPVVAVTFLGELRGDELDRWVDQF